MYDVLLNRRSKQDGKMQMHYIVQNVLIVQTKMPTKDSVHQKQIKPKATSATVQTR